MYLLLVGGVADASQAGPACMLQRIAPLRPDDGCVMVRTGTCMHDILRQQPGTCVRSSSSVSCSARAGQRELHAGAHEAQRVGQWDTRQYYMATAQCEAKPGEPTCTGSNLLKRLGLRGNQSKGCSGIPNVTNAATATTARSTAALALAHTCQSKLEIRCQGPPCRRRGEPGTERVAVVDVCVYQVVP